MDSKRYQSYYQKNREKVLKRSKDRLLVNPDYYKNRNKRAKSEALTYYGNGICACVICGENRLGCLSLDHINDNRTEETARLGKPKYWGGPTLYIWLRKRNYPEGYQTLCMNCQWLKRLKQLVTPLEKPSRAIGYFINDKKPKRQIGFRV